MRTLGLDGALGGFSAALAEDGRIVVERRLEGQVALEAGLGVVEDVLARAAVAPERLDRLAVSEGPGGFTGLRIAITYAKALAQAWELPLVAVSSFDALEYGRTFERVLTVIPGRTGIASARYRSPGVERRASGTIATVLDAVLTRAPAETLDVLGAPEDVLSALAEAGYTVRSFAPLVAPPAAAVALAAEGMRPATSPHDVRADYGEAPAARVPSFRPTPRVR